MDKTVNVPMTIAILAAQSGGIATTVKCLPKGKRWPAITAILVVGEALGYVGTRFNLNRRAKKFGAKLIKYSLIDHVKFVLSNDLPEECFNFDTE